MLWPGADGWYDRKVRRVRDLAQMATSELPDFGVSPTHRLAAVFDFKLFGVSVPSLLKMEYVSLFSGKTHFALRLHSSA